MDLEAAAILRRARELIGTKDRWRGGGNPDGEFCVTQAFSRAINDRYLVCNAELLFMKVIMVAKLENLFAWNDAPRRTHADVLAAFDRAIALAEGKDYAAPQVSTAELSTAPSQEGVGQGALAVAAPQLSDEEYTKRFMKEIGQVKEVV